MANNNSLYCAEQIVIPPDLPELLKQFTKAAIKTQPDDIYGWAAAYFGAKVEGKKPPASERLVVKGSRIVDPANPQEESELSALKSPEPEPELTEDKLKALADLFSQGADAVNVTECEELSAKSDIPKTVCEDSLGLGQFSGETLPWRHFVTLCCASLKDASGFSATMEIVVRVISSLNGAQLKDIASFFSGIDNSLTDLQVAQEVERLSGSLSSSSTTPALPTEIQDTTTTEATCRSSTATEDGPTVALKKLAQSLKDSEASGDIEVAKLKELVASAQVSDDLLTTALRVGKDSEATAVDQTKILVLMCAGLASATSYNESVSVAAEILGCGTKENVTIVADVLSAIDASVTDGDKQAAVSKVLNTSTQPDAVKEEAPAAAEEASTEAAVTQEPTPAEADVKEAEETEASAESDVKEPEEAASEVKEAEETEATTEVKEAEAEVKEVDEAADGKEAETETETVADAKEEAEPEATSATKTSTDEAATAPAEADAKEEEETEASAETDVKEAEEPETSAESDVKEPEEAASEVKEVEETEATTEVKEAEAAVKEVDEAADGKEAEAETETETVADAKEEAEPETTTATETSTDEAATAPAEADAKEEEETEASAETDVKEVEETETASEVKKAEETEADS